MPLSTLALIAVFAVCAVLAVIFCFEQICIVVRKHRQMAPFLSPRIRFSPAYWIALPIFLILNVGAAVVWAFLAATAMMIVSRLVMT